MRGVDVEPARPLRFAYSGSLPVRDLFHPDGTGVKWQVTCLKSCVKTQTLTEPALCEARLPDGNGGRCVREHGHAGAHQTLVAEWTEGASFSRRRQRPVLDRCLQGWGEVARRRELPQRSRAQA